MFNILMIIFILMTGTANAMDFSVAGKDVSCQYTVMIEGEDYIHYTYLDLRGVALFKNTENGFVLWTVDFSKSIKKLGLDPMLNRSIVYDITEGNCLLLDNTSK